MCAAKTKEIDLESMSMEELTDLIKNAQKAMKTVEARRKAEAKKAVEMAAKEYGFTIDDIMTGAPVKGPKGVPKYANPDNAAQQWTGRGRKPNWVVEQLEAGRTLEDLTI